jgi:hypothetical protein
MFAARRLPGIRIDVTPPPPAEVLPRMDVAVFVGFAATGPAHKPVVIESVAEYAVIFGEDIVLALDTEHGEQIYANLGPSVRAFFSNGGRRCWVIRVARTPALEACWRNKSEADLTPENLEVLALANRFTVPGVLVLPGNTESLAPAQAQARCVGSWSDSLRVATALAVSGFELSDCIPVTSPPDAARIRFSTRASLRAGDLIEFGDAVDFSNPAAPGETRLRVYAIIDRIFAATGVDSTQQQVEATLCAAFQPAGLTPDSPPFPVAGGAEVIGITASAVPATLDISPLSALTASVIFTSTKTSELNKGQWLRWVGANKTIWLRIDKLGHRLSPSDPDVADFVAEGPAWQELSPMLPDPVPTRASLLTLDMQVFAGQERTFRVGGLGLTKLHRSSWWRQVSDDVFYATSSLGTVTQTQPVSTDEAARFPLAALDSEIDKSPPLAWIPLGVTSLYGAALGPHPQKTSSLERDGLSRFNAELFLDPELAELGIDSLIEQANVVRFLSSNPRELFGVHAALSIGADGLFNEASLIAVPDALHIGWEKRPDVIAPTLQTGKQKPPAHWTNHRGACAVSSADTTIDKPDFSRFLDCDTRQLVPPSLDGPVGVIPRGIFLLRWQTSEPGVEFILEEAQIAGFQNAREIYRGDARDYNVAATREGIFYYRVIAISNDERSNASNELIVVVQDEQWVQLSPDKFVLEGEATLLSIHRSLLRLAAASGELFAVLGLPRHYRAPKALSYVSRLRALRDGSGAVDPGGFFYNERRALSYGALYHPWVVFSAQSSVASKPVSGAGGGGKLLSLPALGSTQRVCPPDGITIGVLAARSSSRGTWIAPANQSLKDVVALTPPIPEDAWLPFQDAQINLLRADARGFLALAADTLSDDLEWRPINVRRLLILLRRLALRRGASYVFEPNGDVLERAVDRGFTLLLTDLFQRGAFAGKTQSESFRVVTGGAINTDADRDAGRFFVELRVAPSLPLQFITVRLSQSGERFTIAEEI